MGYLIKFPKDKDYGEAVTFTSGFQGILTKPILDEIT